MFHYPRGSKPDRDDPSSYWLLWRIPAKITSLSKGNTEKIGFIGSDKDHRRAAYTSPCSPGNTVHSYTIRVFALSDVPSSLGKKDNVDITYPVFMAAIKDKIISHADLVFTN